MHQKGQNTPQVCMKKKGRLRKYILLLDAKKRLAEKQKAKFSCSLRNVNLYDKIKCIIWKMDQENMWLEGRETNQTWQGIDQRSFK